MEEQQTFFNKVLRLPKAQLEKLLDDFHEWRKVNVEGYRAERWQVLSEMVTGDGSCPMDETLFRALKQRAEEDVDIGIEKEVAETALESLTPMDDLTEEELIQVMRRYREWEPGITITEEDLPFALTYDNVLYQVNQPHTTQADWVPGQGTDSLYSPITPEGHIDDWIQPQGAHDAYRLGDRVLHGGREWESLHDANVWEPGTVGTESLWSMIN